MDSSLRHNLLFKAYESCSISLCSSHCAVVAQWIKSSTRNVNVASFQCRDFLPHHWNKWNWGQGNLSKVVEVTLVLLFI